MENRALGGSFSISSFLICRLEFLTEYEVEVRAALLSIYFVETVGPVDTHHTYHREEDAHTHACRTLDVEWLEFLDIRPCVTAFEEGQTIDGGCRLEQEGEVELDAKAGVGAAAAPS